jgi:hypothetical protein
MFWLLPYILAPLSLCAAGPNPSNSEPAATETNAISQNETADAAACEPDCLMPRPLTEEESAVLDAHFWDEWVGESAAVWVSVDDQKLRIIDHREVVWEAPCATAAKGTGFVLNSMMTPLGWHSVKRKVGDGAAWGQVFRGAQPVNQIWKPGDETNEDLVLTRLLWLTGEEPGVNQGGNVDSYNRYIYIHGTNDEEKIGTPSSHGCVRLRNDDVIVAYDLIPIHSRVLITETDKSEMQE